VTDKARFRADVRAAHGLGYWAAGQQLDPALRGMSVALLDRRGACKGAIGCTTPAASYSQQQLIDKLLPLLRDASQALQPLL
jgi:IclR family pca regulon transcriptional regulator